MGNGKRALVRFEGNVDTLQYHKILYLSFSTILKSKNVFKHDGALCNRSISTYTYVAQTKIRLL